MSERTDICRVVRSAKDELGSTVVTRTDVADVGFSGDKDLGRPKIAELEDACGGVQEKILWFNIAMADADRVDVSKGTEELVHVQFDLESRHRLLQLRIVAACAINSLRDKFLHEVKIQFILLRVQNGAVR